MNALARGDSVWTEDEVRPLIEILRGNNIAAQYVATSREALDTVMAMIPEGAVVGYGDSLSVEQIGVLDALERGPYTLLHPWREGNTIDDNVRLKRECFFADVLVTGTNALTMDGKLVNVDGHGNRVAAMLFGPKKVIIVAGINKIVPTVDSALQRIRKVAAPANARRHPQFDPAPPCATTGICSDCRSAWRICNKTVIIEREFDNNRYGARTHVVIVGESLGL